MSPFVPQVATVFAHRGPTVGPTDRGISCPLLEIVCPAGRRGEIFISKAPPSGDSVRLLLAEPPTCSSGSAHPDSTRFLPGPGRHVILHVLICLARQRRSGSRARRGYVTALASESPMRQIPPRCPARARGSEAIAGELPSNPWCRIPTAIGEGTTVGWASWASSRGFA